jgi:hypothetical protein
LINSDFFPEELLKNFLLNFQRKFVEKVENPLIFSDYLIVRITSQFSESF